MAEVQVDAGVPINRQQDEVNVPIGHAEQVVNMQLSKEPVAIGVPASPPGSPSHSPPNNAPVNLPGNLPANPPGNAPVENNHDDEVEDDPMDVNVYWSVIRCYRPRGDMFRAIMSDEVSSSSTPGAPYSAFPKGHAVSSSGRFRPSNGADEADNAVSTSGIRMNDDPEEGTSANAIEQAGPSTSSSTSEHGRERSGSSHRHHSTACDKLIRIKAKVFKLIERSPGGLFSSDLYKEYRQRYGKHLRYNNWRYRSPVRMMEAMRLKVVITRPNGDTGDYLLSVAPPGVKGPLDLTELEPNSLIPRSCMQYGDTIPPLPLDAYRPGHLLLATIGGITSPSKFEMVKYGANNHVPLERISKEMLNFYPAVTLEMPAAGIRVGQFCSATYAGIWHRARIMQIIDEIHVQIRHVDYGTLDIVTIDDIRPLLHQWSELPMQAIGARLDSVGPPASAGDQWPHESIEAFEALVFNKALFVHIMAVDEQPTHPIAEVAMIDTSTTEDRWIDIELIKAGLADEVRAGPRRLHRRLA